MDIFFALFFLSLNLLVLSLPGVLAYRGRLYRGAWGAISLASLLIFLLSVAVVFVLLEEGVEIRNRLGELFFFLSVGSLLAVMLYRKPRTSA